MRLFDWLLSRSPDLQTPAPEWTVPDLPIQELVVPDDPTMLEPELIRELDTELELEPIYTAIEYSDAKGDYSLRRITMLRLSQGPHAPILAAICHERSAYRAFRTDRIKSFVDSDGVVATAAEFFRDVLDIDLAAISPPIDPAVRLRAPLQVLIAASRCDGFAHPEEIEAIVQYAEKELFSVGELPTLDQMDRLTEQLRRLRPQRRTVERAFAQVQRMPADQLRRFTTALAAVVLADGELVMAETEFLEELGLAGGQVV